jgi:hypothetical protein
MDTQIQTQKVEAPDFSEVIRALQVVVKTGSNAAGPAVEAIRTIRTQQTLPPQDDFDYIVQ